VVTCMTFMNICLFHCLKPDVPVFVLHFIFRFLFPSPEHPLMRARGRSILGGEKQSFQEYTESGAASRFANCAFCVCSSFTFSILYAVYSF